MQLNRSTDYAIQMLLYLAKAGKTVSSSKLAAAIVLSRILSTFRSCYIQWN